MKGLAWLLTVTDRKNQVLLSNLASASSCAESESAVKDRDQIWV